MAKTDFVSQSDDQLAENLGQLKREQFNQIGRAHV